MYLKQLGTYVVDGCLVVVSSGGDAGLAVGLLSAGFGRLLALLSFVVTIKIKNTFNFHSRY